MKMCSDKENIFLIISTSLITKAILIVFILLMIGSLSDTYDMNLYYHASQNILGGNSPWANSNDLFDYPILSLIPMVLSYWISQIVGGGFNTFLYSMQIFMNVCDIIICVSVYYIGKNSNNNQPHNNQNVADTSNQLSPQTEIQPVIQSETPKSVVQAQPTARAKVSGHTR